MAKHERYDLKQMQSLPLEQKIIMTQRRITDWYEYFEGQVYVSFSGGKDSTVLKHIVDNLYNDVPSVFVNTGLEYPEIQKFVKEIKDGKYSGFNSNIEILRPEMRFDEVIKTYGYPVISKEVSERAYYARNGSQGALNSFYGLNPDGTYSSYKQVYKKWINLIDAPFGVSHKCCIVMKKKPIKYYEKQSNRKAIIGTMANESRMRLNAWLENGCNAFNSKRPISTPISFWTEQDIFQYLLDYSIPYASVYGSIIKDNNQKYYTDGVDRTGCMFCMYGCHHEKEPNRFQKMKETHPNQYKYCIKSVEDGGLGLAKVLDYINVPYE